MQNLAHSSGGVAGVPTGKCKMNGDRLKRNDFITKFFLDISENKEIFLPDTRHSIIFRGLLSVYTSNLKNILMHLSGSQNFVNIPEIPGTSPPGLLQARYTSNPPTNFPFEFAPNDFFCPSFASTPSKF